jgi:hypothetical protein
MDGLHNELEATVVLAMMGAFPILLNGKSWHRCTAQAVLEEFLAYSNSAGSGQVYIHRIVLVSTK